MSLLCYIVWCALTMNSACLGFVLDYNWYVFVLWLCRCGDDGRRLVAASVLSPPSDPFMSVLERELLLLLLSTVAWAWCSLGIFLAFLARHNKAVVPLAATVTGKYLEAAVSIGHDAMQLARLMIIICRSQRSLSPFGFLSVALLCCTCELVKGLVPTSSQVSLRV